MTECAFMCRYEYRQSIREVWVGDGVTSVSRQAFTLLENMRTISFPKSLVSVGEMACCQSGSLKTVNFGYGMTTIGPGAFRDCWALDNIYIPRNVTSIGADIRGRRHRFESRFVLIRPVLLFEEPYADRLFVRRPNGRNRTVQSFLSVESDSDARGCIKRFGVRRQHPRKICPSPVFLMHRLGRRHKDTVRRLPDPVFTIQFGHIRVDFTGPFIQMQIISKNSLHMSSYNEISVVN